MKVQLLVSEWCASCHQAEKVWRSVAECRDIAFEVVDMAQPEGKELVSRLRLKTIPALVIDGELKAIGLQTQEEAFALVVGAAEKQVQATRHIGLSMELSGRVALLSSMFYLFIAGFFITLHGGLFADGPARPAPLHVFTIGFLVFLIYGMAEHMLPRFTGNPIRLGAWVWSQLLLTHVGLIAMVTGFYLQSMFAGIGGIAVWLGLCLFALRIWPVLMSSQQDEQTI